MFDHEGEDVDASSASDVGETGTADPERATKSTNRSSNSSSTSDNSDLEGSSDGTNGFNDADDDELAVFDAKLAQALGTHPGNLERNANDSRSSDEDMNDEEMFALDEPMAKVFREQKKVTSKKTEKKDARETMINFKCRVLELLEIYVKQQHANQLSLKILLPVLGLISTTTSPLVSNRAFGLIKEFSRLCKGNGMPKFEDADVVFDLLEAVHTEAMKGGSNAHASACSQASLLLVRILVARDREFLRRIVKMYGALQERALFDSGCKVKTSFFTDWLNWCSSARKLG